MSLSVEELVHMRTSRHYLAKDLSKPSSESIAEQIDAFLKRGGKINRIPVGISGEAKMSEDFAKSLKRAVKASAAIKKQGFGITAAAHLLGVSHGWLTKQCDNGAGPPFYMNGKAKQFLRDEVLAWNRKRLEDEIQTQKV